MNKNNLLVYMPVNYFGSRFRRQVYGRPNDIQYKDCSDRPNNYIDDQCVGCVCGDGSCGPLLQSKQILQAQNRRNWNVARIPASEFSMNRAAFHVYTGSRINGQTWNQSSDRALQHKTPNPIPSHGNSTKTSLTRARPGAIRAGGKGVDIKHNSYARYMNRLKGQAMIAGPYLGDKVPPKAVVNNKVQKLNSVNCFC
jgi:hypothetical protein